MAPRNAPVSRATVVTAVTCLQRETFTAARDRAAVVWEDVVRAAWQRTTGPTRAAASGVVTRMMRLAVCEESSSKHPMGTSALAPGQHMAIFR